MTQQIERWIARDPDPATQRELRTLLDAGDEAELARRFSGRLAFGTAGLRGVVGAGPTRMNQLVIRETSAGLGAYLLREVVGAAVQGVVVGYDGRLDSERFAEDVACVLCAQGLKVYLADTMVPTPLCAFALRELGACAAVVVTASHNPPEYNGYKVYWGNGAQIIAPHDAGIAQAIDEAAQRPLPWIERGEAEERGLLCRFGDALRVRYEQGVLKLMAPSTSAAARAGLQLAYTPLHGVGAPVLQSVLRRAGFSSLETVAEQEQADGTFPTVSFPNPEEPGAMDRVIALAQRSGADLAIANDPDADRFAVAARRGGGGYQLLSGDQVGALLGAAMLEREPEQALVATTIVSSQLLARIAASRGAAYRETLTGFKWIINSSLQAETSERRFAYGYEEALGYCVGQLVRDKDGISAALAFCELAAVLKHEGKTVWDALEALYRQHGLFLSGQRSLSTEGASGALPLAPVGQRLRAALPARLAGRRVERLVDYLHDPPPGFPADDVLVFYAERGLRVVVRPSGTEPKVKCYYELVSELRPEQAFASAEEQARLELVQLMDSHQAELRALGA